MSRALTLAGKNEKETSVDNGISFHFLRRKDPGKGVSSNILSGTIHTYIIYAQ